jgi:hypothetical protein
MAMKAQNRLWLVTAILLFLPGRGAGEPIEFRKEIEPILRQHCLRCHGADKRKGGLLLASRADALMPADSGRAAIVPGHSGKSELLRRVAATEKDERMPLSGAPLSATEIDRLRRWIDQGAVWPTAARGVHWAYVKPKRPALPTPAVQMEAWVKNPIDPFVLARLEKEKLKPSPAAQPERLIRRVYLDLIGLPPSLEEIDAFLKDCDSAKPQAVDAAYEKVVDRLLASPHYGERWARHWLDLARYADSNGFQRDGFRTIWPYRDWVVNALNRDMPFDQFTIEQIAGDLLPGAQISQKIATGFNRCTTVNLEAGTDREENRVNAVFDRVNTTATVWLGTTMTCAQCHNHKYDPFSTVDYYRLFAYFNNTEEETAKGEAATREFVGPKLTLPIEPKNEARRQVLDNERAPLQVQLAQAAPRQVEWEQQCRADKKQLGQLPAELRKIVMLAGAKRTKKQAQDLADYFADQQPDLKKLRERLRDLDQQLTKLAPATTLVMSELPKPRATHVLRRGNFLDKWRAVQPGVPQALHRLAKDAPLNRLGLARWLVDCDNPLVARVVVNRWWAEFFGHGLVATLEDFGTQSDAPTHPELLDWLAVEFGEPSPVRGRLEEPHRWSMKHIHRLIVTSATYRQSSRVSAELVKRDPDNKLYARGPRVRLDAETIRDNALAVSALLTRKIGGPPVMPPQPPGIWTVTGVVDNTYRTSTGADRYRRSLYTIWRRSSPYPSMVAFDAPDRTSCIVKRPRTNTPLQALTLLNDPVYVEAALALARHIHRDGGKGTNERIVFGFRSCLARQPSAREVELLIRVYEQSLARYQENPAAARTLVRNAGGAKDVEPVQWAAWFQVATLLLNLDETITR